MVVRVSQVLLCLGTGFLLTVVYGSSSWLVGEAAVNASVGPLSPPVPGRLGVWAGLWHVNLTYESDNFSLNERVDWASRKDLVEAHRKALSAGWPWPLVSLTAELGGEGMAWRGTLGDGIMAAGLGSSILLVAAMAVWCVWVLLFTVSPQLAARPIVVSGVIMSSCSFVYVVIVNSRVPHMLMVAGARMELHLGFAWWISAALGLCLTIVGAGLLIYDMYRPGQLATIFELDFGSPIHRLNHSSWSCPEPIQAFKEEEVYSQYPWPRLPPYFNDCYVLSDDEEILRPKKAKKLKRPVSKGKKTASTERLSTPHPESSDKNPSFGALQTPEDYMTPTLSTSTLSEGQEHTAFSPAPDTLRRRSPEQPLEQEEQPPGLPPPPQERITPPDTRAPDTPRPETRSLADNHSTILVEKHHPKTDASLRTHIMRRSTRSQKFYRRFSVRLSYISPFKRKSLSLSKLGLYSEMRRQSGEDDDDMDEWVEYEDEYPCEDDSESVTRREAVTSF